MSEHKSPTAAWSGTERRDYQKAVRELANQRERRMDSEARRLHGVTYMEAIERGAQP